MTNELDNFPCKCCGHLAQHHFEYTETDTHGGHWEYLADVGHEVWVEEPEPYPRPVCDLCNNDCIFEQMNNLEYLEYLYESKSTD